MTAQALAIGSWTLPAARIRIHHDSGRVDGGALRSIGVDLAHHLANCCQSEQFVEYQGPATFADVRYSR